MFSNGAEEKRNAEISATIQIINLPTAVIDGVSKMKR